MKVAALMWIVLGTVLAGIAVLIVVATPQLAGHAMKLIPIACAVGFVLAIPLSILLAKRLEAPARGA